MCICVGEGWGEGGGVCVCVRVGGGGVGGGRWYLRRSASYTVSIENPVISCSVV